MSARETLNACRKALIEITAIERQIDRLMSTGKPRGGSGGIRREKVKGKEDEYAVMPKGNNTEAARSQAVDGCEAVLEAKRQYLSELMIEMERLLNLLHDGHARTILRYYYGVGFCDEQIAAEFDTSREVITRKRNAAVNYLESQKVTESHTLHVV